MSIQILITEVTSAEIVDESSFRVLKKKIINESMREIEKKKSETKRTNKMLRTIVIYLFESNFYFLHFIRI